MLRKLDKCVNYRSFIRFADRFIQNKELDTRIGSLFGTPFSLALFGFTADFGELLRNLGRLARRAGHGAALEGALEVDV